MYCIYMIFNYKREILNNDKSFKSFSFIRKYNNFNIV